MYAEVRQNKQTSSFPEGKPYQWLLNQIGQNEVKDECKHSLNPKETSSNKPFPMKGGLVKYSSNIQPMTQATRMWTSDNSEAESATARSAWYFLDPGSTFQTKWSSTVDGGFLFHVFLFFFSCGGVVTIISVQSILNIKQHTIQKDTNYTYTHSRFLVGMDLKIGSI